MLFTSRLKEGLSEKKKKSSVSNALAASPARLASALLQQRFAEEEIFEGIGEGSSGHPEKILTRRHTSGTILVSDGIGGSTKKKKRSKGSIRQAKSGERKQSLTGPSPLSTPTHSLSAHTTPSHAAKMTRFRRGFSIQETHHIRETGGPPAMPPPPLPSEMGATGGDSAWDSVPSAPPPAFPSSTSDANGWNAPPAQPVPSYSSQPSYQTQASTNDGDDFDWSDDDHERGDGASGLEDRRSSSAVRRSRDLSTTDDETTGRGHSASRSRHESTDREDSRAEEGGGSSNALGVPGKDGVERKGTVKKSFNRFSAFVKSGTEAYVLQQVKLRSEPSERHEIVLSGNGAEWAPIGRSENYAVRVDKPKKESKMHGLKSFIAYQLTPASTGIQVSRRYKHFDWLLARLSEKYAVLPVPPLPEKQVGGRYEEEFIEHRMALLQLWVDKISRHPVLARSEVWQHFIHCTDEKKWKDGKRRAEKDEYTGGNFFLSLKVPNRPVEVEPLEARVDSFSRMTRALEEGVKGLSSTAADGVKRMNGPYKRDWSKFGAAFAQLGAAFQLDEASADDAVGAAVRKTAENYHKIAGLFGEQPKTDLEPLQDHLFAYKGILTCIPDMVGTQRNAVARLREHERLRQEGKISQGELDGIQGRVDTIGYTLQAEMALFHQEKKHDFNHMMTHYLKGQVDFYRKVVELLQDSLNQFQD